MTMLQDHAAALESQTVAYHEFLLCYKAGAKIVYGIVEGKEDTQFYRGLIENNLPTTDWKVTLIQAGNKDKVFKTIAVFDWTRFSPKRICFYVDRDLSEFVPIESIEAENLYTTDNYSIENDAVNFNTLERILEEVLNVSGLKPAELDEIKQRFQDGLALFQDAMLPIMAQIILWQRNKQRPNLNNISCEDFFEFLDGKLCLKPQYQTVESRLQLAAEQAKFPNSPSDELSNVEAEFRQKQGCERFIRGKYLLRFMVDFAKGIHKFIPKICPKHTEPPKPRSELGHKNAMVIIAPRVRCPNSLKKFLDRTYRQYIEDYIGDK